MKKTIPYGKHTIDRQDISAVVKALKSGWVTQGPLIGEFEKKLSGYCGSKFAVVFSSGTAALHGAYFAAGIKKSDEVITTPLTFAATSNAALYLGARPVFADIEPDSGNIDAELIEGLVSKKTRAIVPVHYAGHPVNLDKVCKIAKQNGLLVVEDACHALGAKYKGSKVGDCRFSDMAVFSFHPVKSITTGEGGAVLTNKKEFYERLVMFRQHGITKDRGSFFDNDQGGWFYEMQLLGYNYRITDIQCALGISQLSKLDLFIQKRKKIAATYGDKLRDNGYFDLPGEKSYADSAWHLYPVRIKEGFAGRKKDIFSKLSRNKINAQVHYIPVYWHPFYRKLGYKKGLCPRAEDFYRKQMSIPLYPLMTPKEINYVVRKLLEAFS